MARIFLVILCISIIASACNKPKTYSIIPSIGYVSFKVVDSTDALQNPDKYGMLTFSFVDGDGDIGLTDDDTTGVFNKDSLYYHDLFIDLYKRVSGNYVIYNNPGVPYYYRIPYLQGLHKTLQGKIIVAMLLPNPLPADTIRLEFWIYDRALHKSNTITTPDLKLR